MSRHESSSEGAEHQGEALQSLAGAWETAGEPPRIEMRNFRIQFHESEVWLCPERCAYRPDTHELLVADLQLGRPQSYKDARRTRADEPSTFELDRLDAVIERLGARKVTFLGGLFHARIERDAPALRTLRHWMQYRPSIEFSLVCGRNERQSHAVLRSLPLDLYDEPWARDGVAYRHEPGEEPHFIAGGTQPGVRVSGRVDQPALPAFWRRPNGLVLPAFCTNAKLTPFEPSAQDAIMAATPTSVIAIPITIVDRL